MRCTRQDAGELQQVVVNRFQLVRQRIDTRGGQAEVGIDLVGDAARVGLQAKPQQHACAVELHLSVVNGDGREVRVRKGDAPEPPQPHVDEPRSP